MLKYKNTYGGLKSIYRDNTIFYKYVLLYDGNTGMQ